jgi:nicotinate (nicotinamide) nucleotide adenylyltransferase
MNQNEKSKKPNLLQRKVKAFQRIKTPSVLILKKASKGILDKKGRLGIIPGSFNPPTRAHLCLVKEAMRLISPDEILVLLDLQAMDKRPFGATWEERAAMLEILFRENSRVSIGLSNRGLFLDKIELLKKCYPSPIEIVFIVGFDTILRVMDEKYYQYRRISLDRLFEKCRFLVAGRENQEEAAFAELVGRKENKRYRKRISFFNLPKRCSSLSSSLARKKIDEGKSVARLVPALVLPYIEKKKIYHSGEKRGKNFSSGAVFLLKFYSFLS